MLVRWQLYSFGRVHRQISGDAYTRRAERSWRETLAFWPRLKIFGGVITITVGFTTYEESESYSGI